MIDWIKYTVDGKTYTLMNNGDGSWVRDETAPSIAGNYLITFTISENGIITTVDSSNSLYETYLQVVVETERVTFLEKLVPDFIAEIQEFAELFKIENDNFDDLHAAIERVKSDMFIRTSSNEAVTRREKFLGIKGVGTLEQRKSYLISLKRKGKKLNETVIKGIANTISGSDCIIAFYGADELNNPEQGYGLLRVQVLSPENNKDYRYDDIARSIKPLVPGQIKLLVVKYFAIWEDIIKNYAGWSSIYSASNWQAIKDYIPPQ